MPLRRFLRKFLGDRNGYVAILFGLLALPIVGLVGAAVDFRQVGREYQNIRTAAEAAAVAVARSKFKQDQSSPENFTTLMQNVFYANFPNNATKYSYVTLTLTSIDTTNKIITVSASAGVKTNLLGIIGFSTFDVSVVARAGAVFSNKNQEIHFVFDMSPSMGAPDDGTAVPLNSAGCFFMCHDDGSTIRNASKTPKMDTILTRLSANDGFIATIDNAVTTNPIAISANYSAHSFDHAFNAEKYFHKADAADAESDLTNHMNALGGYLLGADGINGGTDFNTAFAQLHTYFASGMSWSTAAGMHRIIIIISDGMHARATNPFDPSVCTSLHSDGDVYTLLINEPYAIYNNTNISSNARQTWDWNTLNNGGHDGYGYYSGLNNTQQLMQNCASEQDWAFQATTGADISTALTNMAATIIAPTIRVIQ